MICWGWAAIESSNWSFVNMLRTLFHVVCNILLKISCEGRCVHVNVTQALFYYRWMMLHKYILNLDSWKNTVCYEDWQLCLVISFSTKKLGTLSTKLELTEHCIISRCFTLASKIFHSQYFNRVQISNRLSREITPPCNTL